MKRLGPRGGEPGVESFRVVQCSPNNRSSVGPATSSSHSASKVLTASAAAPLQILVKPTRSGKKWLATFDGQSLGAFASPFISSARILLAKGFPPNLFIEMWRPNTAEWVLRGRLGAVAATLVDGETAPSRAKNGSPIRFSRKAYTHPPRRGRTTTRETFLPKKFHARRDRRPKGLAVTSAPKPRPDETAAARSHAAERMRRHRARRKKKFRCVTVELHESEIDALSRQEYLHLDRRNDLDAIARALYQFFERTLGPKT